jgi:hypothetical protein
VDVTVALLMLLDPKGDLCLSLLQFARLLSYSSCVILLLRRMSSRVAPCSIVFAPQRCDRINMELLLDFVACSRVPQ